MAKYTYVKFLLLQFYLHVCARFGWAAYTIPPLRFEAFNPTGLRVSIPDEPGVRVFAFHGRVNAALNELEPGELNKDVTKATNGRWVFEDPNVVLHVGDTIGYWVFVQHDYFGYRKDNMTFTVEALIKDKPGSGSECEKSKTVINGRKVCKGALIFLDNFDQLETDNWQVEKYIPVNGPNYEFNYYTPDCVNIKNGKLRITPVPKRNEDEIRGVLDLTPGCTGISQDECYYRQQAVHYLPPVKSGKVQSKTSFRYGRVEIDAKLPCGDWIYPEIQLIPKLSKSHWNTTKIVIAYARGNSILRSANYEDIGGRLLFSGYTTTPEEPGRSRFLASIRNSEPLCRESHKFTIVWSPDEIISYLDDATIPFGQINVRENKDLRDSEYFISLGVAVGGNNDFPNYYTTADGIPKPWVNKDVRQLKSFFTARNVWLPTWGQGSYMDVDAVRIYAL